MKSSITISLWLGVASVVCAGAPTQPTLTRYSKLWVNSVFTTPPVQDIPEKENPLEDYALGGISKLEDGYYAILFNKEKPDERVVIYPGRKNEFEVLDVKWPTDSWRDAVVTLKSGSITGTVSFDDKLLAVKTAPTAAPQGRPNPGVKPPTPGTPTPPGTRTPRPRVVVPKK